MVPIGLGDSTEEGVAGAATLAAGDVEEAVGTEPQPAMKMIKGNKPATRLMLLRSTPDLAASYVSAVAERFR
jgi:hypothetical protein